MLDGKVTKKKTSVSLDEDLWKDFMIYVIDKTGSTHKVSDEIEDMMRERLQKAGKIHEPKHR
jgi:hypothetical protein